MIVVYPHSYQHAERKKLMAMSPDQRPTWYKQMSRPLAEGGKEETGLAPPEIRTLYGLTAASGSGGGGQTVAVVGAWNDPSLESDLATYRSAYGLSPCTRANGCFSKLNQNGVEGSYVATDAGWSQEMALDVDMVSAVCPNCHILVVEANNATLSNLVAAEKTAIEFGATEVNNSWGEAEFSGETQYDSYFNHPGIPITAASGDEGYDKIENQTGVSYPAASPTVIAVGGTEIEEIELEGEWYDAEAWSGAGSGCSVYEAKPPWQTDTGCPRRMVADVSAMASRWGGISSGPASIYDSVRDIIKAPNGEVIEELGTGWEGVSGTSVASPIIAASYALTDSYTRSLGAQAIYEYNLEGGPLYDIEVGSNGSCTVTYFCRAIDGYDGPTGWGTLVGAPIVKPPPSATTGTATELTPSHVRLNGTVDPNGVDTHYYFKYGMTTSYGNTVPVFPGTDIGSETSELSASAVAEGLQPGTTYHFRIVASSVAGTTEGQDKTFTTPSPPIVETDGGKPEYGGHARLWGSVNPEGYATHYHFELGTTTNYGSNIPVPEAENPNKGFSSEIREQPASGLKGKTTYHVRLVATNQWGTTYGADKTFTAPDWRPAVTAKPAAGVYEGSATLNGTVNPEGFDTHYRFEWGASALYGNSIPVPDGDLGSGDEAVAVAKTISGIADGTTYHFRPVATNAEGRIASPDQTFMVHQWERSATGTQVRAYEAFTGGTRSGAPLTFGEPRLGFRFTCQERTKGFVGAGGKGELTSITSPAGEAALPCTTIEAIEPGSCTSGLSITAHSRPWNTEIETIGGQPRYVVKAGSGGGTPSWIVECNGRFLDECPIESTASLKNGAEGAEAVFEPSQLVGECRYTMNTALYVTGTEVIERFIAGLSPVAETEAASGISNTGATLNGTVKPEAGATKHHFEYGATTAYGSQTATNEGYLYGNTKVSSAITGLKPATTYHYRLVATNNTATAYGPDRTFKTTLALHYASSFGSAGEAAGHLREPAGIAVDAAGNAWIADSHNDRLDEFNSKGESIRSVGSYGTGAGQFDHLYGIALAPNGDVWAADGNERVQEFSPEGKFILTVGGEVDKTTKSNVCTAASGDTCGIGVAGAGSGQFHQPEGLAVDASGNLYVADQANQRIEELSEAGAYVRSLSKTGENHGPSDVAIDSAGNVWATYPGEAKIAEFNGKGEVLRNWGTEGSGPGQLSLPKAIDVDSEGNIWVGEFGNHRVQVFHPTTPLFGNFELLTSFGAQGSGEGQFWRPWGLGFYGTSVYVLDSGDWTWTTNNRVEVWTSG